MNRRHRPRVQVTKFIYNGAGKIKELIALDANTGGTGTIRNELQYAYDGLMNVTRIYQSHEGAVNTSLL